MLYWLYRDYSFSGLGFSIPNTLGFWLVLCVIGILIGAMVFMSVGLTRSGDLREKVINSMAKMDESLLLPRNQRALRLWTICSLSASSEEIVFRGFFFWYLQSQFGAWIAAVGCTVLFAIAHAYQGPIGVVRSGIYGAVLMAAYLVSGSIWPPIILHVAQDLYSGVAGYLSSRYPLTPAANPSR
jgi:membrane protease YdiL (CAAX protease family)